MAVATVRTRLCNRCDGRFDLLVFPDGEMFAQDHQDDQCLACPWCGVDDSRWIIAAGSPVDLETSGPNIYGKFSRAFGCVVRDKKHHDELCRQHNVVPMGDSQESEMAKRRRERQAIHDEVAEGERDLERMMDSPEGREYRRMEERGWVADQLRPHVERAKAMHAQRRAAAQARMEERARRATDPRVRAVYEKLARGQ